MGSAAFFGGPAGGWGELGAEPPREGFALGVGRMDPCHHPWVLGVPWGTWHQRVPGAFTLGCFYTHPNSIP